MRVSIDKHKCEGTGYCVRIAPNAFRLGADGTSEVLLEDFDTHDAGLLREAEQTCPTGSIRVGG